MCIVIIWFPDYDFMNFENKLDFLIKPFFINDQKSQDKNLNILNTIRAPQMK